MGNKLNVSQAASLLQSRQDWVILCHKNPDGDAVGSAFGLCWALRKAGRRANVLCSDPIPEKYRYILEGYAECALEHPSVVTVDVASETLLGEGMREYLGKTELCIDHHPSNTGYAAQELVRPDMGATCEMMVEVIREMGVALDKRIADCLYTGLATDTGCFRYSNASARVHRYAAELIDSGADFAAINRAMFETKTKGRVKAEQMLMAGLEYFFDGRCAALVLSRKLLSQSGARLSELDGCVGMPLQIEGVQASVLFTELEDGSYKTSLRTRDRVNASELCKEFGGGGHLYAAGCTVDGPLDEAKRRFIGRIGEYLHAGE